MAFNLPSFYLLFLLPLGPGGRYSKESLQQVEITKVTPTWLKEPFKGEPPPQELENSGDVTGSSEK